jgi:hypothetical protein
VLQHRGPAARPSTPAATAQDDGTTEAVLLHAVQEGVPLTQAAVRQVRELLKRNDVAGAQAFADALRAQKDTETLGRLAVGVVAAHRGHLELAWSALEGLPHGLWARYAADEFMRSGFTVAPGEALDEARSLLRADPAEVPTESWLALLGVALGAGEPELVRDLFARFSDRLSADPRPRPALRQQREYLEPWVGADPVSPTDPRPERPTFAVIDYGHPGMHRASANIGDHVQSIASLGHLVRHQGVRFHGQEDLVDLLEHLQVRTRPELQRSDIEVDLDVMTVHRDASTYQRVPEGTWVLCFGWFMHALFRMRYGFPLHAGLRPIFISFHCNKRELLTDEAVEYLRRYGPVGCRDWTTVYLLLSVGVPAFFSGCLTTTVNTVFPDVAARPGPESPVAYVDVPDVDVPEGAPVYKHSSGDVRRRSFTANCYEAVELLETYRRKHRAVVTSRLHCYLPVRSMGVEVDFQPKNRSDIRFDGLIDITDDAFDAIRSGIRAKLDRVFSAILQNTPEEEVYALWREITAEDVRAAEARRHEEMQLPPVPAGVLAEIEEAVSDTVTVEAREPGPAGPPVHCVVELPRGEGRALEVLVASLAEHASRPLHVWVLSGHDPVKLRGRLAERFPRVTFSWVPTRRLGSGFDTPTGERVRDAAPLMLDRLLPDVQRAVLLPVAAVATADVADLEQLDLEDTTFAAPAPVGTAQVSGFGVLHGAAQRLEHRTQLAAALRRTAHARHAFDFDSFSTDVMVLDLDRMRRDRFGDTALPLVEEFGMTAREVLHYLAGPDHAAVPRHWCHVPTRSPETGPGLTYWADEVKPWDRRFTAGRDLWLRRAGEI